MVSVSVPASSLYRGSFFITTFRIRGLRVISWWFSVRVGWLTVVAVLDCVGRRGRPTLNGDTNDVGCRLGFVVGEAREANVGAQFDRYCR